MRKENNELIVLEEVRYPVSTDEIKAFIAEWKDIPSLDPLNEDKEPYKAVKKAHLVAVKFRTTIEAKRKLLKAPAIQYGKQVDTMAREFQELVNAKELELFAERNKVDQYEKEQEQLRIDAARKRVENIANAITALKMIPLDTMGKSSQELTKVYESIEIPSEEIYAERLDEAILTYKDTLNKLEMAIEQTKLAENAQAIQAEAETKRNAEEAEREAQRVKDREAFEAEKKEFADMKAQQEREAQAQQEEINRQKAEREAEELESKQEKEQATKKAAEAERFEQKYDETIDALRGLDFEEVSVFTMSKTICGAIIDGRIPHIVWED